MIHMKRLIIISPLFNNKRNKQRMKMIYKEINKNKNNNKIISRRMIHINKKQFKVQNKLILNRERR